MKVEVASDRLSLISPQGNVLPRRRVIPPIVVPETEIVDYAQVSGTTIGLVIRHDFILNNDVEENVFVVVTNIKHRI